MPEKQPSKQPKLEAHVQKHIESHVEKHVNKKLSEHLLTKGEFLGAQFKQHISTAIIAAFSFLIALSWKDLIVRLANYFVKEEILRTFPYISELISAIVVTIIAILGILIVTAWARKPHVLVSETKTL